jgi:hypothetical protein
LSATWNFLLTDSAGVNLAELSTGAGRTLTFARNAAPEAHVTISHDDGAATVLFAALRNGIPKLRGYRNGTLRFHLDLAPFDEQLEEGAQLNLTFRGPFTRLLGYGQSRGRFTAASFTRTATDAGQIAKALIDTYGTGAGVATTGTITASKTRDRAYQYANVGEAIVNLTRVLTASTSRSSRSNTAREHRAARRLRGAGVRPHLDRPVSVRAGDARELPQREPADRTADQHRPRHRRERTRRPQDRRGVDRDVRGVVGAGERVRRRASRRRSTTRRKRFSGPTRSRSCRSRPTRTLAPLPWDDYWLGDTVSFFGRRGAFYEDATMRVDKITVVIDDDGNEAVEVERPGPVEAPGTDGEVITAVVEGEVIDETPAPVDVSEE